MLRGKQRHQVHLGLGHQPVDQVHRVEAGRVVHDQPDALALQ